MGYCKFKPLREIVLVKRYPKKADDGGIIIPELWQQFGWRATVVAVGDKAFPFGAGDEILFLKEYTVLPFGDRTMATTHAEHILAKIVAENFVERIMPENRFAIIKEDPTVVPDEGVVLTNVTNQIKSGTVLRAAGKCYDLRAGLAVMYEKSVASCVEDGKHYKIVDEGDVLCITN